MVIKLVDVDYIPATQRETTVEYENVIKAFSKSTKLQKEVITDDDRIPETLASGLRRALVRMGKNYETIFVRQRNIDGKMKVYLEKKEK